MGQSSLDSNDLVLTLLIEKLLTRAAESRQPLFGSPLLRKREISGRLTAHA
jgi:hypothetical protein